VPSPLSISRRSKGLTPRSPARVSSVTIGEESKMSDRPTNEELSGMTVNERLFSCGLFDRWTKAAKERKKEEMIGVLSEVALTKEQATEVVDKVLSNPAYYGL
jgi:hypothetical protein